MFQYNEPAHIYMFYNESERSRVFFMARDNKVKERLCLRSLLEPLT